MSIQESKDHALGKRIAEALGLRRIDERNLYRTEWGPKTPIGLTRTLRTLTKETK